jgi:hypothetical protein
MLWRALAATDYEIALERLRGCTMSAIASSRRATRKRRRHDAGAKEKGLDFWATDLSGLLLFAAAALGASK